MQPTTTCDKMSGATTPTTWEFAVQDGENQRFSLPAQLQFFPGSSLDFGHSNGLVDPLVPYLYPLYNWTSNRIN